MAGLRRHAAEFVVACLPRRGSAVAARTDGGVVAVALTFGFTLLVLVYAIGPISGCHVNPAVTIGALLAGRISLLGAAGYWTAQFGAATLAGLGLWILTRHGGVTDQTGSLATNSYGPHINLGVTFLLEIVLTYLLVLVVLVVTSRSEQAGFAGLAIGLALAATNLAAITLDGASINPARSLGPAIFEGGEPLRQLWVFIVAPLVGGILAAATAPLLTTTHARYRRHTESAD
ncbi:MIP/aquaporin family protein [Asanoa siamensis]|uniref:Aquaporin Z n=1 Tax=Asanoa siamensis TaxID=926357 RepID=A0ABQ4CIA1_9ACTN|nr:aquaporin [Asanoa siamensis]GIF71007.1 putative aquaporin Z [Asanoa siamensis]